MSHAPANDNGADLRALRELHWRRTRRLSLALLLAWMAVSFASVFFARALSSVTLMGFPLSFYLAAQGAGLAYLAIIAVYALRMRLLERRFAQAAYPEREVP